MTKKRSHGEGYVSQLKSGMWRGQLMDGYTPEGKKCIVAFKGPTKKDVLLQMREYQSLKESNVHLDRSLTLREWAKKWYEGYRDQVQPSTYSIYRYTLNIIQERLGDRKLNEILPMDIEQFIRTLREDYSESQVTKCRSMLIQIYDEADANGLVARNPARKAKRFKNIPQFSAEEAGFTIPETGKQKKDAFTPEEIELLRVELRNDMVGNSILLMLGTGLRTQELLALIKDDIAEDGSSIQVSKAVKTVNGKALLGPPKSERGNRIIPVPDDYRPYAIYLRAHGGVPFLWTLSKKNPLCSVKTFRKKYYSAVRPILGIRTLPPHCCRHTYVTQLEAKGIPMEQIARLAGHSKIETTNLYLHTALDTLQLAVSVLNKNATSALEDPGNRNEAPSRHNFTST